jgi:hypothetical protein
MIHYPDKTKSYELVTGEACHRDARRIDRRVWTYTKGVTDDHVAAWRIYHKQYITRLGLEKLQGIEYLAVALLTAMGIFASF